MNWFQRIRRYVIVKTAESYYDKMAVQCDELHDRTRKHHYVIIDPWEGRRIVITNRDNFRATKRAINDSGIHMSVKGMEGLFTDATMPDVHKGCFYSSMLRKELEIAKADPDSNAEAIRRLENDIEIRRRAYVKWALDNARIRKGPFSRLRERIARRRVARAVRKELEGYRDKKPSANT